MTTNLGINLLKNRHTLSETEYLREQEILRYSLIGFIGVVVLTIAIVGYQLVLTTKLNKIEDGIATANQELLQHSEASAQQIYLKSRLKLISDFLEARSVSREAVQRIFSIAIPGVVVSGMSFESDNTMKAQFTADDPFAFSSLVDYLSKENDFFIQTLSDGLVRTAEGKYQLQALLTVPVK